MAQRHGLSTPQIIVLLDELGYLPFAHSGGQLLPRNRAIPPGTSRLLPIVRQLIRQMDHDYEWCGGL